ncbi:MAG TPA: hypothetical protein DCS48_15515 [Desulfovibrio sp.]|nr:hypothetical protein [Desulfovibrio sp.]
MSSLDAKIISKIGELKDREKSSKAYTVRLTEWHVKKLIKHAKKIRINGNKNISEGKLLVILAQAAIEHLDDAGEGPKNVDIGDLQKEVASLDKKVSAMQQLVQKISNDLGVNFDDLNSVQSEGTHEEADESHESNSESKTAEETD